MIASFNYFKLFDFSRLLTFFKLLGDVFHVNLLTNAVLDQLKLNANQIWKMV